MHIEQLSLQKSIEKWILTLGPVLLLDLQEDLMIDILLFNSLRQQTLLDLLYHCLAGQQPVDFLVDVVVHFGNDLPSQFNILRIFEILALLLHKTEESCGREVFPHFFELRNQVVPQPRRLLI